MEHRLRHRTFRTIISTRQPIGCHLTELAVLFLQDLSVTALHRSINSILTTPNSSDIPDRQDLQCLVTIRNSNTSLLVN